MIKCMKITKAADEDLDSGAHVESEQLAAAVQEVDDTVQVPADPFPPLAGAWGFTALAPHLSTFSAQKKQ